MIRIGPSDVIIRPPLAARIYLAVFGTVWCGICGFGIVAALVGGHATALLFVGFLMIGSAIVWRGLVTIAAAVDDTLLVRNQFKTWRIPRSEISTFRVGVGSGPPGRAVQALLLDGTVVTLDVTRSGMITRRGERLVEHRGALLQQWLGPAVHEAHGPRPADIPLPARLRRHRPQ